MIYRFGNFLAALTHLITSTLQPIQGQKRLYAQYFGPTTSQNPKIGKDIHAFEV
jgi:hypothetical protein